MAISVFEKLGEGERGVRLLAQVLGDRVRAGL